MGFISVIIFFGNFFSFLGGSISIFHSGIPGLFESISFKNLVEFTRANYSIFSLIINLGIFIYLYIQETKTNKLFLLCIFLLIFPQILGLLSNKIVYNYFNIQSLTTMIFMISAALNIVNLFKLQSSIFFKYIFIIPFFILFIQLYLFFHQNSFFNIQYGGFYLDFILFGEKYTLYFNSNGLGRSTSLIYAFCIFYFFESKNNIIKITFYILAFLSIFIVINLSGRFNILMVIVLNIIIYLYYKKIIIEKWYFTFLTVILLTISFNYYKSLQKNVYLEQIKNEKEHDISHNIKHNYQAFLKNNKLLRESNNVTDNEVGSDIPLQIKENSFFRKIDNLSTGRLSKWIYIFINNEKFIFGHGPNMDRIFFRETVKKRLGSAPVSIIGSDDAASGIAYQYISGGAVGLISLFVFYILLIKEYFRNIFKRPQTTNEKIFITLFIVFSMRIIFENGFIIFGIDYLFAIISIYLLTNKYSQKN